MERLPIFHERLLLVRRRRGLSQAELAAQAHLFKTDISKYERGQSMPTLPRLVRLTQVLGTSADYLLGLVDEHGRDEEETPRASAARLFGRWKGQLRQGWDAHFDDLDEELTRLFEGEEDERAAPR
jgi:transcriptional regulator with XRE-family HTH domain